MTLRTTIAAATLIAALGGCVALRGRTEHARLVAALPAEAQALGWEQCVDCHTTVADWFAASFHAKQPGCETCHGPGDLHVSDGPGNIVGETALESLSPQGKSQMCLACHVERAVDWPRSDHARGGLACAECHTDGLHSRQDGAVEPPTSFGDTSAFCTQCHAASAADFRQPFHHPVAEGAMSCTDCHSPHGEHARRPELAAARACASCHAPQSAAKVFRHEALEEGCAACHVAHGGPLQGLLLQDGNGLCLQCHHVPAFPVIAGVDHRTFLAQESRCWDCHVEIHGSNSDPSLLGRLR